MFRQLTAGIKFDKKRYRNEAEKFGLVKKQAYENKDESSKEVLDKVTLDDDFVPDSNLPTPDDSDEDVNDIKIFGRRSFVSYFKEV